MRDVPVPLVRCNQYFLVGGVVLAALLRTPAVVVALLAVVLAALWGGARWHLVFLVARPLLRRRLEGAAAEDGRMQRFNQALAALMLAVASALFALGLSAAAWTVAAALAAVALAGALGFCLGCRLYRWVGPWLRASAR